MVCEVTYTESNRLYRLSVSLLAWWVSVCVDCLPVFQKAKQMMATVLCHTAVSGAKNVVHCPMVVGHCRD